MTHTTLNRRSTARETHRTSSRACIAAVVVALLAACGDAQPPENPGMRWPGPCTETAHRASGELDYRRTYTYDARGAVTGYVHGANNRETGAYEERSFKVNITSFEDDGERYVGVISYDVDTLSEESVEPLVVDYQLYDRSGRLHLDIVMYSIGEHVPRVDCLNDARNHATKELEDWWGCDSSGMIRTRQWVDQTSYTERVYSGWRDSIAVAYHVRDFDQELVTFQYRLWDEEGLSYYPEDHRAVCETLLHTPPYESLAPPLDTLGGCVCPVPCQVQTHTATSQNTTIFDEDGDAESIHTTTDTHQNPVLTVRSSHGRDQAPEHIESYGSEPWFTAMVEESYALAFGLKRLGPATPETTTTYTYDCWDMDQHNTAELREAWRIPKPPNPDTRWIVQ